MNVDDGIMAMCRGDKAINVFTDQLKEYFNVNHCFLLSSGKASLTLILQALKELYPDRDEVLIPAFTCYSVPAAIIRAGLKVRICDVEPETLDFDYRELAEQLSYPRILCVIPTHLFGVSADIPKVRALIGDRDIPIVEDAAQSMGAECNGRKVGTLGDIGFFSLGRGKAFSTVSGGVVVTNLEKVGAVLDRQFAFVPPCSFSGQIVLALYAVAILVLSQPWLFWIPKSLPFLRLGETHYDPDFSIKRLSAFQAGTTVGWQRRLIELRNIRQQNAGYLCKSGVMPNGGSELLSSGVIRFPVMLSNAAEKMAVLRESGRSGLGGAEAYPSTVDCIEELQGCIAGGTSEKAQSIVDRLVTFPVHPYVTEMDMDKIAALLRK